VCSGGRLRKALSKGVDYTLAGEGQRCGGDSVHICVAGGKDCGVLFVKGKEPRKVEGNLAEALISEARIVARERAK
jgi:hypothetical protein